MENPSNVSESSNDFFCVAHSNRPFKYICMDLDCIKHPNCCIICIKNNHKSCESQFILEKSSLKERLEIVNVEQTEIESFQEDMKKMYQEIHVYMTQKYKKYMSNTISYLGNDTLTESQIMNPEVLLQLKSKFNLKIKENDKIVVTPKIDLKNKKIEESLRNYKEEIRTLIDQFSKDLEDVQLTVVKEIRLSDFVWHSNIGKKK